MSCLDADGEGAEDTRKSFPVAGVSSPFIVSEATAASDQEQEVAGEFRGSSGVGISWYGYLYAVFRLQDTFHNLVPSVMLVQDADGSMVVVAVQVVSAQGTDGRSLSLSNPLLRSDA